MGEREISHCRDLHPTSHVQLVRLHNKVVLRGDIATHRESLTAHCCRVMDLWPRKLWAYSVSFEGASVAKAASVMRRTARNLPETSWTRSFVDVRS